jgi:peroxiredoxin
VRIVGAGLSTPAANQAWAEQEGYRYELWTDDTRTLGVTYGALDNRRDGSVARITVLLDADGTLLLSYLEDVVVGTHPGQVLADCEALFGR